MRCWRTPDGGMLVEVVRGRLTEFHHLAGSRLVRSYQPRQASASEELYTFGYEVFSGRFEQVTVVEVEYPYRRKAESGDVVLAGLVRLPDGTVSPQLLAAALANPLEPRNG